MSKVQLLAPIDRFFERSKSGAIWGRVYLDLGNGNTFPNSEWTDLTVAVALGWLRSVLQITVNFAKTEIVHFFDGPFEVQFSVDGKNKVLIECVHSGSIRHTREVDGTALLHAALDVATGLLASCSERGWAGHDVEELARLVRSIRS